MININRMIAPLSGKGRAMATTADEARRAGRQKLKNIGGEAEKGVQGGEGIAGPA